MGRRWNQVLDYVTNCQTFSKQRQNHTRRGRKKPDCNSLTIDGDRSELRDGQAQSQAKGEATRRMRYFFIFLFYFFRFAARQTAK